MKIFKGLGDFFALDIGTNAIRVVQLSKQSDGWKLDHYGYAPVDRFLTSSDSEEARRKVSEVIMTAIGQSGTKSKNVVIGLPSSKTFTTVVEVPMSSEAELKSTMKYQVDQYIPMAVDDSKIDWALLGGSLKTQNQQEVLLSSVARQYSEDRLEMIEALGFNVIAAEPDPIAMVRALTVPGATGSSLQIDMGEDSTDIAIVYGDAPRLVRTIPTGVSTLVKSAVNNLNVEEGQARQFIVKFGLDTGKLDGQVYRAIESVLESFVSEINKSIKFFETRYEGVAVDGAIVTGFAASIPLLREFIGSKTGKPTSIGEPWQGIATTTEDQNRLAAVRLEFTTAIGLAKREGDV